MVVVGSDTRYCQMWGVGVWVWVWYMGWVWVSVGVGVSGMVSVGEPLQAPLENPAGVKRMIACPVTNPTFHILPFA